MASPQLKLTELTIANGEVQPARVHFRTGLNIIEGSSNTGKSYILDAIDVMFGASNQLRRPPVDGYDRVLLSIDPTGQPPFTLRRGYGGGQYEVTEYGDGREKPPTETKKLSSSVSGKSSLSAYLLKLCGLYGRQVRKSESGEKTALTIRDVAHLTIINEDDIIKRTSPISPRVVYNETRDRNVFAFFLTNQDDSQIIEDESREDRNARIAIEEDTIEAILLEKRNELAALLIEPDELSGQAERLENAIREASQAVVATKEEIATIERRRSEVFDEKTRVASRNLFLSEQLKRLRLLSLYYGSDRDRLQAVVEASQVYHGLPEGSCPLCTRPYSAGERKSTPHQEFEQAYSSEIQKIADSIELQVCGF